MKWQCLVIVVFCSSVCGADSPFKPDISKLVSQAESCALQGQAEESFKAYQKAVQLDDNIQIHRQLGHLYFECAEKIRREYQPKLEASGVKWESAREEAMQERKSLVNGKFKKLNEDDPKYKKATAAHREMLEKVMNAFPFYDKAQEAFNAVLRLAPKGKDFDAAAHQLLCLTVKGDMSARLRGRQLLVAFLSEYKPSNDSERAVYDRCQAEFERISK